MGLKKWFTLIGAVIVILFTLCGAITQYSLAASGDYKILAWNDLGMHCYNRDFADLAVLPPYNNLWVQVVKVGDPPTVVTDGITVEYYYADNIESATKTNFWDYDQDLFGVNLPLNEGLKGKGLAGTMDLDGDHFVAEGIPVTEFSDSAPTVSQPYQLATVVVKNATTGTVLTSIEVVTPVSSEMRCDNCHSDTGIAKPSNPTGKVETNILQLHDEDSGTNLKASRPVLCAECHASNALGMVGKPGIKNLSESMHEHHAGVIPSTLDGCYNCHPGPQTQCLRDVMANEHGVICASCHGGMAKVAQNPNPWLNEPRCDGCHNTGQYNQDKVLYRHSKEHGGLYCEACHDSTHAIAPSREANDGLKFVQLQGNNGTLEECSVCHATPPASGGPHSGINSIKKIFKSIAAQDGWILETAEASNKGGTLNSTSATFYVGDNAQKKQYRSILSFNTKDLPDGAVITKVTLKVRKQGVVGGGNPVNIFRGFMVDVKKGFFGTIAGLQGNDFQANVPKSYGPFKPALTGGWYAINLTPANLYINKLATNGGVTQIRLRFKLDDNNNSIANDLSLYSGNAPVASRPQLIVEYYVR
jgi:hypothetical protein